MSDDRISDLLWQLRTRRINRRQFFQRAAALGLSAPAIAALARPMAAGAAQTTASKNLMTIS